MRLQQVDLNQLYTFRVVIDAGGIGAAAVRLGRTQPAISARIKQLEQQLGVDLFERVGRGIRLTARGEAIARELDGVLNGVVRLMDVSRADDLPAGKLRIGSLPTVSAYLLAPALTALAADHPDANIELVHGLAEPQLAALRAGEIDVVASVGDVSPGLAVETIAFAEARVVLPRETAPQRLSLRALRNLPLLAYGRRNDPFFDSVWRFMQAHDLTDRIRLAVPNIQTLKSLVVAGGGATILPAYTVDEPQLVTRSVRGLDVRRAIWLASRKTNRQAPLVRAFFEQVHRCVRPTRG